SIGDDRQFWIENCQWPSNNSVAHLRPCKAKTNGWIGLNELSYELTELLLARVPRLQQHSHANVGRVRARWKEPVITRKRRRMNVQIRLVCGSLDPLKICADSNNLVAPWGLRTA